MSQARPLIFAVLGVLILTLVLYNAESGLYYYEYPNQTVHYKLNLAELVAQDCSQERVNADLDANQASDCVSPLGTYHATDIILAFIGLLCILAAPIMALRASGGLRVGRRLATNAARLRLLLAIGLILVSLADLLGLLTASGQSLDWSSVIGFSAPSFLIDVILLLFGIALFRNSVKTLQKLSGKKSRYAEPWEYGSSSDWRGSLEKRASATEMSVGDLRRALSLDQYEDIFQVGTSSGVDEMKVGRTCHYCNGQGCPQCGGLGELDS